LARSGEAAKHEEALEALRAERAKEIRAAIDAGVPRVEIARQLDLSPQRLRRILRS
jgi:DNA invertase Pin-like site-specific DNA recombinase